MAYFKIGNNDYSTYVNKLKVDKNNNYISQTNAAGDTVVDLINKKRTIEVGIIPLNDFEMKKLQADLDAFNVKLSFRNPQTGSLESNVNCIIPSSGVEYYTIQANKVLYNAFTLTFIEL
jgi:hypothetical protein